MKPHEILMVLWDEGIMLRLTPDGVNLLATGARLRPCERDVVLAHKPALIEFLTQAQTTTAMLIAAAMRRCDEFNDNDQARADMRLQCLEVPPHLHADLHDHFQGKPAH